MVLVQGRAQRTREKPEKPKPKPVAEAKPTQPKPAAPLPSGPEMFSAEWFRENLPKYKDLAWNNPTVENVRTFLYLQRFAIDRSEQFSDATELAVVGDPFWMKLLDVLLPRLPHNRLIVTLATQKQATEKRG